MKSQQDRIELVTRSAVGPQGGDGTTPNSGGGTEGSSSLVDVETDVDSLKSKLSNLTNQQILAKGIKDSQIVSLFRADFRLVFQHNTK